MFCVGLFSHDSMLLPFMRVFAKHFQYIWILKDFEAANTQLSDFVVQHKSVCMLELNTEKEGCISYAAPEDAQRAPEDAQRPRAVYDIHPDFI